MRLATFNILHGLSLDDGRVDLGRLRAAVHTLDADLLALQEVDQAQERSAGADLTALAAEAMGAVAYRFAPAIVGTPGEAWAPATGDEQPGCTAYGISLLSRYPVRSWQVTRLPGSKGRVPMVFPGRWRPVMVSDEPRVALAAVVEAPTGPMTVATTHLSFIPGWNARQLRRLLRDLAGSQRPLVLMGDLNMGPSAARRISGLRPLVAAPTYPLRTPQRQLDHVLVDGAVGHGASSGAAVELPLSDHRALTVDVPT